MKRRKAKTEAWPAFKPDVVAADLNLSLIRWRRSRQSSPGRRRPARHGRLADLSGCHLDVLLGDGGDFRVRPANHIATLRLRLKSWVNQTRPMPPVAWRRAAPEAAGHGLA